jgi:polyhydroxybutyrate depolymerase
MRHVTIGTALALLALLAASPASAQDRVSGDQIRDRIRDRIEQRRLDRAPKIQSALKTPGGGPGYESLLLKGVVRTFVRYTPNTVLLSGKRAPVVFALHGGKGSADKLQGYLGLNAVADKEGFIVVYPQGINAGWNDGRDSTITGDKYSTNVDDYGFLEGLADALVVQGVADGRRLYLIGLDDGGALALRLACDGSGRFAAYGSVGASVGLPIKETCKASRAVPLVMIHGTDDKVLPLSGTGERAAPLDVAQVFVKKAVCGEPVETKVPQKDPADTTSVERRTWATCKSGVGVEFYTVKGGGHQAPTTNKTSASVQAEPFVGARSRDFDTGEAMWGFFKRFAR